MSYDEFKKIVKKEFTKDEIEGFGKTDNGYGVYVIAYGEKEIEIMCDDLRQYGFECRWWHSSDPEDDEPIYFIEAIPIMNESKNSTRKSMRKSIKESSVRVVTFQQIVDSRFDNISKGEEILDDRKNEIVKLCGNDFSVYTTDRHFVEFDDDTQWRETYYVRKNNNNVAWDDLYKIVNSVKPCRYKFDKINDSHFESKKLARKSLKESVEFSKEKDIYIAQVKDSSISFAYTPIDTDDDFNGYVVFDGEDMIQYLNWKGGDINDMLKAFDNFEKAVKKYTSKEDAKIIIKDFHDKLGI